MQAQPHVHMLDIRFDGGRTYIAKYGDQTLKFRVPIKWPWQSAESHEAACQAAVDSAGKRIIARHDRASVNAGRQYLQEVERYNAEAERRQRDSRFERRYYQQPGWTQTRDGAEVEQWPSQTA